MTGGRARSTVETGAVVVEASIVEGDGAKVVEVNAVDVAVTAMVEVVPNVAVGREMTG